MELLPHFQPIAACWLRLHTFIKIYLSAVMLALQGFHAFGNKLFQFFLNIVIAGINLLTTFTESKQFSLDKTTGGATGNTRAQNNMATANNTNTSFATETIVAFHIGRGGRFNNAGFKSFLGAHNIGKYTDDLFTRFSKENNFKKRFGFDRILDLIADRNFDELEEAFGITEEMLGEEIYFDNAGNAVGLTAAEVETGIGTINIDEGYDTTYTCKLSDCDEAELQLIRDSRAFDRMSDDAQEYINEKLNENYAS